MLEQSFEYAHILSLSAKLERSKFYERSSEVTTLERLKAPTVINRLRGTVPIFDIKTFSLPLINVSVSLLYST